MTMSEMLTGYEAIRVLIVAAEFPAAALDGSRSGTARGVISETPAAALPSAERLVS